MTIKKFPHYYPSLHGGIKPEPRFAEPPYKTTAAEAYFYDYEYEGISSSPPPRKIDWPR